MVTQQLSEQKIVSTLSLPQRVVVREVVSTRYPAQNPPGAKPVEVTKRRAGSEQVRIEGQESPVTLFSDAGQSTPQAGWELLLLKEDQGGMGYLWTLYGIRGA